ncbi:MAG: N-acetylmuramoyl-L-alanine amidase [Xanthomonadales bacterium]|nr:N-acetylmuramoyl-L-alanine amidase [Xanthomonadales bacterium]NIN59639.1 N-acetylmuramoyl-L-alanine amidase [Xanthomonadales bacterium]NIN75052.1 N-acetylmuramoyl-L-alanine amidase [Xanthomonadales bacterium]NIO14140.1 N-acetylmuramoyl-L-alanine amidase [Xanthomonadales bacterium]NIP12032.1 N-acetylmuramoyl-L-alanine amidase [Xanthomonadales bacterium]
MADGPLEPAGGPALRTRPLSYEQRLRARHIDDIDLLVIHCTELPTLAVAREYGERIHHAGSETGNSGHYYIDRDGRIECWVVPERIAHHTRGYNGRSVGIELVNTGRWPHWFDSRHQDMSEPYPEVQMQALVQLARLLCERCPHLAWVAGHEDLDRAQVPASDDRGRQVYRKRDPGPAFDWRMFLDAVRLRRGNAETLP